MTNGWVTARCDTGSCVQARCESGNCVEAEASGGLVILRSTNDVNVELSITREEWNVFVDSVKAGDFDGV